jgi:pyruvate-formate lyase-activating enzyme
MTDLAASHGKATTVRLLLVPGLDHDEAAIAKPAQRILSRSPLTKSLARLRALVDWED